MTRMPGLRRVPAGILSAAHVLLNRSHPWAARTLLAPLSRCGHGLGAARARALEERIRLESGAGGHACDRRWRDAVDGLLGALDETPTVAGPAGGGDPGRGTTPARDVVEGCVEALTLAFHPLVHQAQSPSPLVADPVAFAALLDPHPVMGLLRGRTPSARRPDVARQAVLRHRLLVLTDTNLTFMADLLEHWRTRDDIDLRVRDLAAEGADPTWWSLRATVTDRLGRATAQVPAILADDLAWADTVWVEWGGALAARLSGCDLDARLVVRLHRFEAFTAYPRVTRWENVDDLILVSGLVQRALERCVADLGERTRIHVVPNVVDLRRFHLPKRADARRVLALVGWGGMVKDPDWALDVLDALRLEDPTWRLLLVGAAPTPGRDTPTRRWSSGLAHRVRALGDAVGVLGFREDVPEVLRHASVILSSSLVESAHLALQQGAAAACLPVVRDWPGTVDLGGPRLLYPHPWVVGTPEEAARRILDAAASPRAGGHGPADTPQAREASSWVLDHLDASRVLTRIDALLEEP